MKYGFTLNFEDLPKELLDEKFEDWVEYLDESEPERARVTGKDREKLREEFKDWVEAHFPVYF